MNRVTGIIIGLAVVAAMFFAGELLLTWGTAGRVAPAAITGLALSGATMIWTWCARPAAQPRTGLRNALWL